MKFMQNRVDVIILSLAADEESFQTTKKCVDSYIESANELINKIYIVETNKDFNKDYQQPKVELIIPREKFNYNRFYNFALEKCTAEFVFGPNNDLVIHKNCIQNIVKEFDSNPDIDSISPVDREWHRHTKMFLPSENKLYYGYEVSLHMFGCVFCCRRSVFEKIGYLDETFYFFYQDNDYVMSLERCGLRHGVFTGSKVSHHSGHSNRIADDRLKYTPKNMNDQGDLLMQKWNKEPFKSGGYKQFKSYK